MVDLGEFALNIVMELLANVIQEGANYTALPYFQRRKIERRIEDATAEVVEPLLPFLAQEGIPEDRQRRLIQVCIDELRPLTRQPERLFQGSLNGQKIFEELYAERDLPQVVIEDGLKDIYTLLCPRIATLLCKMPTAVKDWESEAWSENFRRFDEMTTQMRALFNRVDELAISPTREADEILTTVRRTLAQKIRLELDLTGLRADRPLAGRFDDFFVHPCIMRAREDGPIAVGTSEESLVQFTQGNYPAIVIGPPGAGKSTWSKWLQREVLSTRWTGISVRVEFRRFSGEPLLSLHELIREAAGKHLAEELTADRIGRWLDAKQVIFILDGFDEIQPGKRDEVYEWIVELSTAARGCPFILTSRSVTTDHLERLGKGWQQWTIEPFDRVRIIDYIQRWYTHTPLLLDSDRGIDASALAKSWVADPTIGPLTGNPLLLSTLLMVHHLDGSLPTGRSQLYQRYVDGMLGSWDDRRRVTATTIQLPLEQKRQILRGLALNMFLQERDQLDEPAAIELVRDKILKIDASAAPNEVLAMLRERSGLIVGPGIYGFIHKSVAEYLVAEAVLQGDQRDTSGRRIDRFVLFEHRDDDRWNTVIFLWAGLAPIADVESFVDTCIETGSWALASGILEDQYERMPAEIRRQLLLKMISGKPRLIPFKQSPTLLLYSHPRYSDLSLEVPAGTLRGLAVERTLYNFFVRPVLDGTLAWSDSANAQKEFRDLLWIAVAYSPRSIAEWKACLEAPPCPDSGPFEHWLFWAAETVFSRAATDRILLDLEILVEAYRKACPSVRGLVPIALISSALSLIESGFCETHGYGAVVRLLEVMPSSDDGEVSEYWLEGTADWTLMLLGSGKDPEVNIGDLLTIFVERVEELVLQGTCKADAIVEHAIDFVEELQERRDALPELLPAWLSALTSDPRKGS